MGSNHILVVEDSLTQAVKLEYILFEKGFKVSLVSNGENALQLLEDKDVDLVISDVVMPGMDGYELCEKIRKNSRYKDVPVILLTSLSEPGDIIKGLKSGATNFVTKPYDEGFLISRIESVLKNKYFDSESSTVQEVDFEFQGDKHVLKADFSQVFHLLLATYENTLLQSRQLDVANRKLLAREEQLSSVLASMSAKIAVLDTDMMVIAANDSWREIFLPGTSEDVLDGIDFRDAVFSSGCLRGSLHELVDGVRSVVEGNSRKFSYEYSFEQGGEPKWYLLEVTPMQGESGGAVASFIEITERKEMERELITARDAAEKANRFKSRFLASMSHEIRTPLNAIIGLTDLTLRSELSTKQAEDLELVKISADQLLTLINDILDLSKVEARMLTLEESDFSLSEAMRDVVRSMEQQARDKGLALNIEVDDDVPEAVCGDQVRLKQILYNLIGNSIKFTENGGVFVQVSKLEDRKDSDEAVILVSVRDTGIGIPDEKQNIVFESFRQADDSTTRKFGGTGLGLAISRELVEMMGGRIGVKSSEGFGSVFSFHVVLKYGDSGKLVSGQDADSFQDLSAVSAEYSILLVEDNPINVLVATSLLEKMGHSVEVASNGLEAVSMLSGIDVDLVLMDLEMPEMDGFSASMSIRRGRAGDAARNVPIIAMTAHAMTGVKDKCAKAGMNDYIAKPVQYVDLRDVILRTMKENAGVPSVVSEPVTIEAKVIDPDKASAMYQGDSSLYNELCSMFMSDVSGDIAKFKEARESNKISVAKRIVHTLKSSCAAICAPRARDAAVQLEKALLNEDAQAVEECLAKFEAEATRVCVELTD
ncbi:response regulator [Maridesulfovibrio salexigens]|uniref:Sensory/regulatory protein RpfC n=1 Tax=Maridesulfovibrio salexigens (strain ATCC 14822 / DSM 2638 / NCIMB 8403 / VKM B-1763) TaxID=526222 RepID=C6C1V8_MARSD|nr:response regulator [Maridesulfovibrio salexigens]ACS79354.1 multi-sensor hybrid histidine kinase [Maridesulfovibrio salexigens DSM 2638]